MNMQTLRLPALVTSAAIVLGVAFAITSGSPGTPADRSESIPIESTSTSSSTTLTAPVVYTPTSNQPQKAQFSQVSPISDKSTKKLTPDVTPVPEGLTATTTPGMPDEPVDLANRIPDAEADPDANEHMSAGEDYDLPTDVPAGL